MKQLALVVLFAFSAHADVVLRAARMYDGTTVVSPGVVVVSGNRIAAAGPKVSVPAGAEVIDLGDATLLPGLVDAHTHLSGELNPNFYLGYFQSMMTPATEQTLIAANHARKTLEAGFTTVRDLGSGDLIDIGLRNAIRSGVAVGPRMFVASHPISATGGHGDSDPVPPGRIVDAGVREGVCNGAAECLAATRYQMKYGADVIKMMPSGGVLSLSDPVDAPALTQEEMNAIVEEAHHFGRKVAAHCHGDTAAKMAVRAGVDSIEHGSFLQSDTLQLMKERGTYLVATLMAGDHTRNLQLPPAVNEKAIAARTAAAQMFRRAVASGVKIAFGTDSGVSPHAGNAREFSLMTANGMTPAAALGTIATAAELIGVDAGILAAGKLADVIAVPGNPLEDIRVTERVFFVMKDGAVVKSTR